MSLTTRLWPSLQGLPFRERFVGVKKLVHVIYLQKETSLSLCECSYASRL